VRAAGRKAAMKQARAMDLAATMEQLLKWRTIVADDNRDSAHTMAMLLKHLGHEVETVHDGAQALEAAQRSKPQAMVLDIGMPKLNGYEVARRIRAEEEPAEQGLDQMLLIALTGWGQPEDKARTQEAGFDVHLVKPVSLEQMRQVFQQPSRRPR
jgi:CheY-like chemotaxis protein